MRERLYTKTMGRQQSATVHTTVGWASTNGETLLKERINPEIVQR